MPQLADDVKGNLRMLLLVLTKRKLMDLQLRINCGKAKCSVLESSSWILCMPEFIVWDNHVSTLFALSATSSLKHQWRIKVCNLALCQLRLDMKPLTNLLKSNHFLCVLSCYERLKKESNFNQLKLTWQFQIATQKNISQIIMHNL